MVNKKELDKEVVLTRGTKKLITKAIEETGTLNNGVLCDFICNDLCSKFAGDSLDYQLERMNIKTTKSIMDAIDVYVYRHSKDNSVSIGSRTRGSKEDTE